MDDFKHLTIQLKDIKAATNDFSDKPIGTGGFGAVYKAELLLKQGRTTVAIKRLDRKHGQGDVEFWKEITMLSDLKHENLATLLHFCREGNERILVYEYASNGSLDSHLGNDDLTWTQRLNICIGAANGIAYLHDPKKTQHRILHRDIKSSNILLDYKWTAKVSDFGLSKNAIADRCLNRDRNKRPSMIEIVKELEVALHHQQNSRQFLPAVAKMPVSYEFMEEFHHLKIQLEDVIYATDNFSDNNITGRGGFGAVYKGELSLLEGRRRVCFKRLDRRFGQGDVEFWKEIRVLSRYQHENVVSLLRFCKEGDERIIVYEYASRGSLDRYLSEPSLTWTQRLRICLGIAHAIKFLHDPLGRREGLIHRDIKSLNIILDEKWSAKVCDFSLSKIVSIDQLQTYVISNVVGTPGYCDPLYFETGMLSKESDMYSFGVVLFEVMSGRLCFDYHNGELTEIIVNRWRKCYEEKRLDKIIFHDLEEQADLGSLDAFSALAYQCVKKTREERPTIAEIIKELGIALERQEQFEAEPKKMENLVKSPLSNTSKDEPLTGFMKGTLKLYQKKVSVDETSVTYRGFIEDLCHLKIRFEDIKSATNNFNSKNIVRAHNGFGTIYKGALSLLEGKVLVACKHLVPKFEQENIEFWKEIMMLSKYKHENIISLLHFCDEGDNRIIVYEYASRGSLAHYLSKTRLTWTQRLKICLGVAHALNYLHHPLESTHEGLLHRDIQSSNIFLDEEWGAKVCDFGMSKIVSADQLQTYVISNALGTPGYCDPLYRKMGLLSKESDVYSFGVVLFEVMCGKLCYEYIHDIPNFLVPSWRRSFESMRLDEIVPPYLKVQMNSCSLNTFSRIAYQCVKMAREDRPTMAEVVKQLEFALEQQVIFEDMKRLEGLLVSPNSNKFENQLFLRIPKGIHARDGKTWLSKFENGKHWEIISAIKCISSADHSLRHESSKYSRFSHVLRGVVHNGFSVRVETLFLSPNITYAVSLIFNHNGTDNGTHIPFEFKLDGEIYSSNPCIPQIRDDGWLMIELFQFKSNKREHDFEIHFSPLFTITSSNIEYFLEGIEFRPVEYVSR